MARRNGIDIDMAPMTKRLKGMEGQLDRYVAGVVLQRSHIAVGWMKENASWTDRTGAARNGLRTQTEHVPLVRHSILLMHSVAYGIWLEVRWAGRYAILQPAMLDQGQKLMITLNKLMRRLGR